MTFLDSNVEIIALKNKIGIHYLKDNFHLLVEVYEPC